MVSFTVHTSELDDVRIASTDLYNKLLDQGFQNYKAVLGIAFCDCEIDMAGFAYNFHELTGINIICSSAIASIANGNLLDMSINLLVLCGNDFSYKIAVTDTINNNSVIDAVKTAYNYIKLEDYDYNLLYLAAPFIADIVTDDYVRTLSSMTKALIMGGVSSFDPNFGISSVCLNGRIYKDRAIVVGIIGRLKPVCVTMGVSGLNSGNFRRVKVYDRNKINIIDDLSFVDFLKLYGLSINNKTVAEMVIPFAANPAIFRYTTDQGNYAYLSRSIIGMDFKDRSGLFSGPVPANSYIAMSTMTRKSVLDSIECAISNLKEQMSNNTDYTYTTVLGSSCIARYLVLADKAEDEGIAIKNELPDSLNSSVLYSMGEFYRRKNCNPHHCSESITLCAF